MFYGKDTYEEKRKKEDCIKCVFTQFDRTTTYVASKENITKAELFSLVLCPLMSGKLTQKERVLAAYGITRKAIGIDAEIIRKVEAVIYIMADKFLDSAEME